VSFKSPEQYRVKDGVLGSSSMDGNNGFFIFKQGQITVRCLASDGMGWEHVSISLDKQRCPDWEEMCLVKSIFWDEEDCVIQFHPPKSEYVSYHKYCLHLWRKAGSDFERPPKVMVGPS
jgi:hypothetical protein